MRIAAVATFALLAAGCHGDDVSRTIGARCDTSDECDDRCLPDGTGYPGGFCTLTCTTSDACPSDTACVDRDGGVCLFLCLSDASCAFLGAGWRCQDANTFEQPPQVARVCHGQ